MDGLPARGPHVRELGLELPPTRARDGTRPLKRWRYVGVYTPELMLCVGDARVGPIPQRWWAVALPDGSLHEGKSAHGVIDLSLEEDGGVEVVSPHGGSFIWTRKQALVPVTGRVVLGAREFGIDDVAFIDDSAGYHARHTAWQWSAGHGRLDDGRAVGWNLVTGVHDGEPSERTVWVEGEPHEVGPVEFADDLSRVGDLDFKAWAERVDHTNLLLFRNDYRQPFGTFSGELPGGLRLAAGYGVMEEHDVRW
jgi:Protein of unknown function (DUF2804)